MAGEHVQARPHWNEPISGVVSRSAQIRSQYCAYAVFI